MKLNKVKDYWMATMAMGKTREEMEQFWSTEDGMLDLMDWFEAELELGLTEEEMNEAIKEVLGMIETEMSIGNHRVVIERFGKNDYAVYYVEENCSTRGTLAKVFSEICDTYGDCINDIREVK